MPAFCKDGNETGGLVQWGSTILIIRLKKALQRVRLKYAHASERRKRVRRANHRTWRINSSPCPLEKKMRNDAEWKKTSVFPKKPVPILCSKDRHCGPGAPLPPRDTPALPVVTFPPAAGAQFYARIAPFVTGGPSTPTPNQALEQCIP